MVAEVLSGWPASHSIDQKDPRKIRVQPVRWSYSSRVQSWSNPYAVLLQVYAIRVPT